MQPFIARLKQRLTSLYLEAREDQLDDQVDSVLHSKKFKELTEEFARALVIEPFPEPESDLPIERIVSSEEFHTTLEELKGSRCLHALEALLNLDTTDVLMK